MTRLIDASEIRAMMAAHARGGKLDAQTFSELLADDIHARLHGEPAVFDPAYASFLAYRDGDRERAARIIERASDDSVEYVLP